jgi:hypothetical protein
LKTEILLIGGTAGSGAGFASYVQPPLMEVAVL